MPPRRAAFCEKLYYRGRALRLSYDDRGVGGVLGDGGDALLGAGLGLVAFGFADILAVGGLQAEAELAGLVLVQFVFRIGLLFVLGLVLDVGRGVLLHGSDAVFTGGHGRVGLGGGQDDFAVGGLQIKGELAVFCRDDYEFACHSSFPFQLMLYVN